LVGLLQADGWTVLAPHEVDGVVGHAPIESLEDLPRGRTDVQDCATYRLVPREDGALFGYAVGPQSWKSVLFPARELIRRSRSPDDPGGQAGDASTVRAPRLALFGVRSCDLHAIEVQDRVLRSQSAQDTRYVARREAILVVAVTCSDPGGTCFCASMGTGPDPSFGYDIALTEVMDELGHRFVARPGSERGAVLLTRLDVSPASDADLAGAAAVVDSARSRMGRSLDTADLRDLLYANADHPRWDDVAARCLACSNCTMVCPTCFCTTVTDTSSLVDGASERWRVWDSCFTGEITHLEGGDVRSSTRSRYRQWATHKLASWWDQFGTSGCVGCGRCITWCPAAIDLTAEIATIRATSALGSRDPRE
jgi:formate hydrogenlyase subunit 6/NADH:ubiquinone oxidoreductase subunit I